MAERLKQEYDIVVLKTELVASAPRQAARSGTAIRFTLQYHADGQLQNEEPLEFDAAEVLPALPLERKDCRGRGPSFSLPAALVDRLRDWFGQHDAIGTPLWVHLVKPYGGLRLVPWERLLGQALDAPVLMLPDFIFRVPRETTRILDVVVCGSAPLGYEASSVQQALCETVQRVSELAGERRVRLHVFTDADIARNVNWSALAEPGSEVKVYPAEGAAPYVEEDLTSRLVDSANTLRSPWLLWMRNALAGRAVDVVHFVCHGYMARERGALLFAQSPIARSERYLAGPVSGTELQSFLTQVGAWSTVFTALPDNHSDPGLRALADDIAQSRPGPLMMYSSFVEPGSSALANGYRFLYASKRSQPPRSNALFIYCQPALTAARARQQPAAMAAAPPLFDLVSRNIEQRATAARSFEPSPLEPLFLQDENVSSWVAATERYAESVELRHQQLARDQAALTSRSTGRVMDAELDTLERLRSAVAQVEARSGGKGGGA